VRRYRGDRDLPDLSRRTVILVDDGVATGGTMRAAVKAVRERNPAQLVVAAPVVAFQTAAALLPEVDDLVYVEAPEDFIAVGVWYKTFGQTTDEEVVACLEKARRIEVGLADPGSPADPWAEEWIEGTGGDDPPADSRAGGREVSIPVGRVFLSGYLGVPAGAEGIVVFAHGSGSSRRSPRNQYVAGVLRESGLATLLMDLLTPEEAGGAGGEAARFDVDLLARRLVAATRWLGSQAETTRLVAGYFGASTGAAAALVAAAAAPDQVRAVVSRGGRPDLAGEGALAMVRAPTLLVVGGRDEPVIEVNRTALALIPAEKQLVVVPGASHLFEEPGTLEAVARLAADWFGRFLRTAREAETRA
jgi:putative phosphoribosyl transferase